jgi:hypothetical protein
LKELMKLRNIMPRILLLGCCAISPQRAAPNDIFWISHQIMPKVMSFLGGRRYAHVVSGALSDLINQNAQTSCCLVCVCLVVVDEERARQFA